MTRQYSLSDIRNRLQLMSLREQLLAVHDRTRLDQLVFGLLRAEWLARRSPAHTP